MVTRAKSTAALGLGLGAGLAFVALLTLWLSGGRPRAEQAGLEPDAPGGDAERATAEVATKLRGGAALGAERAVDLPPGGSDERRLGADELRGRVLFPAGTPADERVRLALHVSDGAELESIEREIEVEPGGAFVLGAALAGRAGELVLEARYLRLEEPWKGTLDPAREIVLAPELGARLELELTPPAGDRFDALDPPRAVVESAQLATRTALADESGRVVLDALPAGSRLALAVECEGFADLRRESLELAAGRTTSLALVLERGVRIAGRVLDARGRPVEDARITARSARDLGLGRERERERATSDAGGRFVLAPVSSGDVRLEVEHAGHPERELELGAQADGARVEGLEIVLREGRTVAGRVLWSDGRPVGDARVDLIVFGVRSAVGRSGEDGSFLLAYEGEASEGRVRATAPDDVRSPGGVLELRRTLAVQLGPPLELVLDGPGELRGHVVEEVGGAVTGAVVIVRAEDGSFSAELPVADPEGRFHVTGIGVGALRARAEVRDALGRTTRRGREVQAESGEEVELVLPGAATLAGRVLAPEGGPAADARVRLTARGRASRAVRADAEGAFVLDGLDPVEVQLWAERSDGARSETLELTPGAGLSREDLELVLRAPARVEGQLVGNTRGALELRPAGRELTRRRVRADASGRFAFEGVAPGAWTLVLAPEPELLRPGLSAGLLAALRTELALELAPGESRWIDLGSPLDGEVPVRGRVVEAGRGVGGAEVRLRARAGDRRWRFALSEADGSFALALPETEAFEVEVHLADGVVVRFERVVRPSAGELVLALPGGRIRGRLVGAEGRSGAGVSLELQSVVVAGKGDASVRASRVSAVDGGFELAHLVPGRYVLRAGGGGSGFAELVRVGLVVEQGGTLDLGVLELSTGGALIGRVLDADGRGVRRARLRAYDASGRRLLLVGASSTGRGGTFRWSGLPVGEVRVQAAPRGGEWTEARAVVRPEATVELEIRVDAASAR